MNQNIDYVITYIDYSQKEISELYEKVTGDEYKNDNNINYIDFSLVLKSILKNLSFINHIYVVCKDVQTLDKDTEKLIKDSHSKIIRVNESEFMPDNYITFSSACIEMFIWKIPGLSEYFIYGNDDMIPLKPLERSCFFSGAIPIEKFKFDAVLMCCLYDLHCSNATNLIFNRHNNNYDYHLVWHTEHTLRPITKKICELCFNEYEPQIMSSLWPTRFYNNFNFDIFMLYALKNNMIINKEELDYSFKFTHANLTELSIYETYIDDSYIDNVEDLICINDPGNALYGKSKEIKEVLSRIINKMLEL